MSDFPWSFSICTFSLRTVHDWKGTRAEYKINSHSESGRNRESVTQPKTIWRKHQQSLCESVHVCVFDTDPAERQDTYSAVSGETLVYLCSQLL